MQQKNQLKAERQGTSHLVLSDYQRKQVNEFEDMSHEFRRLFSELLGTFFLVLVACSGPAVDSISHSVGRAAEVTAPGLMVGAIILFMGTNSGAHLNPAVTLAFSLRRDFHWKRVPGYVLAQVAGAVAAAATVRFVFGPGADLGLTRVGSHFDPGQALIVEALLTFGLISTVLGAASGAQNIGPLAALAAGSYIVLAGLWGSPVSGASMNPARSFGPALIAGDFTAFWVYVAGPVLGAVAAVLAAYVLRGQGGGKTASRAAQGTVE